MSEFIYDWTPNKQHRKENIVRCRDCAHRRGTWNGKRPNFTEYFFCSYTGGHEVKPNGFCAWGERRGQ